nr:hypothetical protein [Candidatus Dojkabacteria bacterium]
MAIVNKVQKSGYMDLWDIVKFQVSLHCNLNNIIISDSDVECLTLLAINGETELTEFCNAACEQDERTKDHKLNYEREIFKTPQSVRNSINKIENIGLINKKGKSKKKISIGDNLKIQSAGNIFIE